MVSELLGHSCINTIEDNCRKVVRKKVINEMNRLNQKLKGNLIKSSTFITSNFNRFKRFKNKIPIKQLLFKFFIDN